MLLVIAKNVKKHFGNGWKKNTKHWMHWIMHGGVRFGVILIPIGNRFIHLLRGERMNYTVWNWTGKDLWANSYRTFVEKRFELLKHIRIFQLQQTWWCIFHHWIMINGQRSWMWFLGTLIRVGIQKKMKYRLLCGQPLCITRWEDFRRSHFWWWNQHHHLWIGMRKIM